MNYYIEREHMKTASRGIITKFGREKDDEINRMTCRWRDILQQKKQGPDRLLFLLNFNDTEVSILDNIIVFDSNIVTLTNLDECFWYRFSFLYDSKSYRLEGQSRKGDVVVEAGSSLFHLNKTQMELISQWLLEI